MNKLLHFVYDFQIIKQMQSSYKRSALIKARKAFSN
jgi:hypothetical protein